MVYVIETSGISEQRQPLTPEPPGVHHEEELERLCRIAAWTGASGRKPAPLSFTALLIAFLIADDPVSRWFQVYVGRARVDAAGILGGKNVSPEQHAATMRKADAGLLPEVPEGRPLFSTSAKTMLGFAAEYARTDPNAPAPVIGTRHLMAAYAFRTPSDHHHQIDVWGFDQPDWQKALVGFLAEQRPEESEQWRALVPSIEQPSASPSAKTICTVTRHISAASAVAVLPDGRRALSGSYDKTLRLWDLETGSEIRRFQGHTDLVLGVAVLPDGRRALSGSLDNTLRLWDLETGSDMRRFEGHTGGIGAVAVLPDGRRALSGSEDTSLRLWNLETGSEIRRFEGHTGGIGAVAVLPDGRQALSGSLDNILRLWDLETGSEIRRFQGHTDRVLAVAVLPDGRRVLSGSADGILSLWDLRTGAVQPIEGVAAGRPDTSSTIEAAKPVRTGIYVANYTADDPLVALTDVLDVEDEGKAFARIAASKTIRPPLSIGIFGEWGSGKTFFMGRMFAHVKKLSERPAHPDDTSPFHRDIVQIRFNAWHYIETNLWASLVEYIFHELDLWLRPKEPEGRVDALFDQLATSRQLKLEAIEDLILIRRQKEEAEKRLEAARRDYENALVRRRALTPKEFWKAVAATFTEKIKDAAAVAAIDKAGKKLGLKDLSRSARELHDVLQKMDDQVGRGTVLARSVLTQLGHPGGLVILGVLILLFPAAMVFFKDLVARMDSFAWLKEVNSAVLGFSSLLAVIAAKVGFVTSQAQGALDTLQSYRDQLDQAIAEKTKQPKEDFAEAERNVAIRQSAVEQAERQLAEAGRRVDEAARQYESGTARGRLNQFIRDKVVNGDYARHLGIIASIRKDFGYLAQIMVESEMDAETQAQFKQANEEYQDKVKNIIEKHRAYLEQSEIASLNKTEACNDLKLFKRIILYIDDLDRCPPAKVVEVLQAIHLLLCFPLFVVVVAVDARWVSRSLRDQFPSLLQENVIVAADRNATVAPREEDDGQPDDPEAANRRNGHGRRTQNGTAAGASSQDYLEKIFQIPYWVRPMKADASKRYVESLAAADKRKPESETTRVRGKPSETHPAKVDTAVVEAAAVTVPSAASTPERPRAEGPEAAHRVTEAATTVPAKVSADKPAPPPSSPDYPVDDGAESMFFSTAETDFMREMAPFIGQSPRRGIRFVNVYRLVKTSLKDFAQDAFVGPLGESLAYRALLTQLAIVTGAPRIAWFYFQHLSRERENGVTLDSLCAALNEDLRLTASLEWPALNGALQRLHALNTVAELDTGANLVTALRDVAPIAMRYSFTAPH